MGRVTVTKSKKEPKKTVTYMAVITSLKASNTVVIGSVNKSALSCCLFCFENFINHCKYKQYLRY
jgi:hypothetical protein